MHGGPQHIVAVLADLMARRGFARLTSAAEFEAAWRQVAGDLAAQYTRVGLLRRGKLEITVAHSVVLQELAFRKRELLESLARVLGHDQIKDLRFRLGAID